MHGGELVEQLRIDELQPGWNSSARIIRARTPPTISMVKENKQVQRADVLVVGGEKASGASR